MLRDLYLHAYPLCALWQGHCKPKGTLQGPEKVPQDQGSSLRQCTLYVTTHAYKDRGAFPDSTDVSCGHMTELGLMGEMHWVPLQAWLMEI